MKTKSLYSTYTLTCSICGKTEPFILPTDQLERWLSGWQTLFAFPNIPATHRAMLASRICSSCFPVPGPPVNKG